MAVVVSTLNNPWFVVLAETARDRAKELGYEATVFDSQNDPRKESAHFDNIIRREYDAMLFNCTDADGSIANVRGRRRRACPCSASTARSTRPTPPRRRSSPTTTPAASSSASTSSKRVGENGKYAELLGIVGDNNTWNRSKGFHSVVDQYPGLKMVAQQSADFDRAKALEVMESLLQANPDIDAVFCGNDAMAMGAYQALRRRGKADKVMVFGFDGADDVVKAIAEGKIEATVMQYPKVMARTAAESADKYIKGERELPQKMPVAVDLVTKDEREQVRRLRARA